ncbi:hypothetical protein GCK72_013392 [Caenorhabditis remanei]|uniref:Serine/threonine-protein phosphatase n=1 Tax=Caenorhabditis remanei TaxID=31234 RepID=A0A6A5GP04_CAERE|nr:hypothetical protein GCK72_013392 [Caenorhabditis remanei]KAF1756937.1 hypothetical protein GCK72_013392 [Caenorhabditis remanei]
MIARIEKFGSLEGFADSDILEMLKMMKELLEPLPCLLELVAPVIVFGDIHGQLSDLLEFVKQVGRPPDFQYLLLGDYVDRGDKSLETVVWLFCMKILFPKKVHLLRGNHEVRRVNALYGFKEELVRKRNDHMWKVFNDVFAELPICASINRKILCMHGGISTEIKSWLTLSEMSKSRFHKDCENGIVVQMLWADPNRNEDKCRFNRPRGISNLFGQTAIEELCTALDIDLVIRAHELKDNGYAFEFDNQLLTVFSAPYYSGCNSNSGSVVTISRSLKLRIVTLKPIRGHDSMVLERQTAEEFEGNFQPFNDDPLKTVTCQYNMPKDREMDQHIDSHSMFAHETKHCKKLNEGPLKPLVCVKTAEENTALATIRKTMKGYGMAISLKDESMSLESIRRKLGITSGKDKEKEKDKDKDILPPPPPPPPPVTPVKTPTPDPPASSPPVPPSPHNSAESA